MKSFLSVLYLLAVALVAAAPISPLDDSFYHEPAGLERHEVGAILKSRVVYDNPLASDFFPMNVKNTYQLMIRSLDAQDRPCTVVTTVVEPFNGNSSRVLSYLFAKTDSWWTVPPTRSRDMEPPPLTTRSSRVRWPLLV
jgi:hypothetical protein